MTDYESIALEKIGHHFRHELGSLIGDCLAQMPAALESEVLTHLNTQCNVYKAPYDKHLSVKRTNWGNEKEKELPSFLSL